MRVSIVEIRTVPSGGIPNDWDEDRWDIERWENDGGRSPETTT